MCKNCLGKSWIASANQKKIKEFTSTTTNNMKIFIYYNLQHLSENLKHCSCYVMLCYESGRDVLYMSFTEIDIIICCFWWCCWCCCCCCNFVASIFHLYLLIVIAHTSMYRCMNFWIFIFALFHRKKNNNARFTKENNTTVYLAIDNRKQYITR